MIKLAKYLRGTGKSILGIILLLALQAYCDLSLPGYTSKIVTKGIQQKGVEDAVPERMREETFEDLKLFLDETGTAVLEESYTSGGGEDGQILVLNRLSAEERTALGQTLRMPELFLYMISNPEAMKNFATASQESPQENPQEGPQDFAGAFAGGESAMKALRAMPAVMRSGLLEKAAEQVGQIPDTILEQTDIRFVQQEYEAMGINLGDWQNRYLLRTGGVMLLLALLVMAAAICVTFLASRLAAGAAYRLRGDIYRRVLRFNSQEFHEFSTASLITRSTNDIQQVQIMLAMGLRMVLYAPILGIGGIIRVVQTQVSMGWIIVLAVALLLGLILLLFAVAMPRFTKLQTLIDGLNLVTREQLTGVMVTRAFSAEKHEEQRFEEANRRLTSTNLFVNRCMTFMMPVMMLIMNGISVLIVYTGAREVDSGMLQVGDMMAFIQYTMQIIMSFLMIALMSIIIPRANVAAKRIAEVLEHETLIRDPEKPVTPDPGIRGEISFEHVSFAYPDAQENVLTDITFTAHRGETVAVIGSTGSGKSTLVNLIPRFYDVTEGSVKVDGVDVRDYAKAELCGKLGYVPQKSTLFSGTIDSNIRYGAPKISAEEVRQAAKIAQAEEFIEEKENRYQSHIAQGGTNVSGGQRQRLSIARAIASDPEILILDDSFSALDFKTDAALRKALREKTRDVTVLIVAQRISTILHADRIIVLDMGRMVGYGPHQELMETCEVYRQIAMSQLSGQELAG